MTNATQLRRSGRSQKPEGALKENSIEYDLITWDSHAYCLLAVNYNKPVPASLSVHVVVWGSIDVQY